MKIVKFRPRGVLKYYVLKALEKQPLHGYKIREFVKSISGFWTPSPGTLYPLLNAMREDGLIEMHTEGRRNIYRLTRKGMKELKRLDQTKEMVRASLAKMLAELTGTPTKIWEEVLRQKRDKLLASMISVEKIGMKKEIESIVELAIQAISNGKGKEVKKIMEHTKKQLSNLVTKNARKKSRKTR